MRCHDCPLQVVISIPVGWKPRERCCIDDRSIFPPEGPVGGIKRDGRPRNQRRLDRKKGKK